MFNIVEYNIWKVLNAGKKKRFYESEKQFIKFLKDGWLWNDNSYWTAYRFTSNGWIKLDKDELKIKVNVYRVNIINKAMKL